MISTQSPQPQVQQITFASSTTLKVGDTIDITSGSRAQRLRALLTRPRVHEIIAVHGLGITITVRPRRMTWREWRRALWRLITDW